QLQERRSQLDYARRVRVEPLAASLDTTGMPSWKTVLLSRGLFSDLKGVSKLLSRATLACLTLALIGVAGGTDLSAAIWNRIIALDDLQVEVTRGNIDAEWERSGESAASDPISDDDQRAVQILTQSFARTLSENPTWRSPELRLREGSDFERRVV